MICDTDCYAVQLVGACNVMVRTIGAGYIRRELDAIAEKHEGLTAEECRRRKKEQ